MMSIQAFKLRRSAAWPTFTFLPETRQTLCEMEAFFKKENAV